MWLIHYLRVSMTIFENVAVDGSVSESESNVTSVFPCIRTPTTCGNVYFFHNFDFAHI